MSSEEVIWLLALSLLALALCIANACLEDDVAEAEPERNGGGEQLGRPADDHERSHRRQAQEGPEEAQDSSRAET